MKNHCHENGIVSSIWHVSGKKNRISVPQRKRPSGGRVEWEETRTFEHSPSLVVCIPSIAVVEAKKNLNSVPPF
jgi:hypothetical protein